MTCVTLNPDIFVWRRRFFALSLCLCLLSKTTAQEEVASEGTAPSAPPQGMIAPAATPPEPSADPNQPPREIPFASQPYRVLVDIGISAPIGQSSLFRQSLQVELDESVQRMFGRMWQTEFQQSQLLIPADVARLQRIQVDEVLPRFPEQDVDKVFFLNIAFNGVYTEVACREYDTRVQELTPIRAARSYDLRAVPSVATVLMRDSFRPVVMFSRSYEDEDGRSMMELQVQAGEIIPPDSSAQQVIEGDVLRPFIRSMERRDPTKLRHLQVLPLSYIRIMAVDREVSRGLVEGVFVSHMAVSPFGGKGRRLQHIALRQRPTADHSRVRLVLQSRPDKPLIAHRMALAYQLGYKDEEDGPQTQLVSDRNGEVVIERRENHPTFWIRVYSGASLLARVPYAPGLLPFDTIALPDDSIRLRVEGELQLLQDELIDAIAVREVLIARASRAAEKGDVTQVNDLLKQYSAVPSRDEFVARISNIQIPAAKEAAARGLSDRRIVQACKALQDTVQTFFTDEKRTERQAEMEKIRSLAEQNEGRTESAN